LKRKRDGEAFLDGYKPALLIEKTSPNLHFLEGYPSYSYDEKNIFFFQNERVERKFLQGIRNLKKDSFEEHCLVGLTLGYPKRSVEFFAKEQEVKDQKGELPNKEIRIGMIWAGFWFITNLYILIDETKWMWERYRHPKAVENPVFLWSDVNKKYLIVPYGDYDRLKEVHEYIMKERGLIVTNK